MQPNALALAVNASGAAATVSQAWPGGRASLVLLATTYPSTCFLQVLGSDGQTWVNVNTTTYSANQVISYDIPAGQVRMNLSGGTVAGLYAALARIPYG